MNARRYVVNLGKRRAASLTCHKLIAAEYVGELVVYPASAPAAWPKSLWTPLPRSDFYALAETPQSGLLAFLAEEEHTGDIDQEKASEALKTARERWKHRKDHP